MTGTRGMVQTAPPPVSRGTSLFPPGWRAAWGPVGFPTPASQARYVWPKTPEAASGGNMVPVSTLGRFRVGTPDVGPRAIVPGAPRLTNIQNRNNYWRPRIFAAAIAPMFAQHTRRFSDHPLPVPSMAAWRANPVAQRPARLGGSRVTRWPNPVTAWPTFGPGGT